MCVYGFPGGSVLKNLPAHAGDARDTGSIPVSERPPGGGNGEGGNTKPTPVFMPEKFCGQRSLGCEELDTNEYIYIYTHSTSSLSVPLWMDTFRMLPCPGHWIQ